MNNITIPFFSRISLVEKFNFYEYLSVMLDGGVSISETLSSVKTKIKNPHFVEKITELETYVSSGDSVSKSMKKLPQIFSFSEISIIEAGESMGKLSSTLSQLAENLRKNYELRKKVKTSLTYPLIIFLFLILAIVIVLVYVIPAVSELFENAETELPIATQMLVATSDFVINNWALIIVMLLMILFGIYAYINTETGKANYDYLLLRLPLVGKVYRNYLLAHFSTLLGVLVSSGVPIVKSISLAGRSLNNLVYQAHLEESIEKISAGEKITTSLQQVDTENKLFPLDYLQMLSVGEKTASLGSVTKKLTQQYTREVDYSLANLTKWIEPLAILISGVFVLWFAFAIFGAILQVTQTVS